MSRKVITHLDWLFSLERFGMKLGLAAVRTLLAELDWPLRDAPTVIVAGTNGKGSTAAMTAALLTEHGVRTLLYTSPHVTSVRERIRVDGRDVSAAALETSLGTVRAAIAGLRRRDALPHHPTFFETLTAAALVYGRRRQVAAAVLEVGLGGRYDATNAMPADVAVITPVARDHEAWLGADLGRIAWNKAGIISAGSTVISAPQPAAAGAILRRTAQERSARLRRVPVSAARRRGDDRWDLDLDGRWAGGLALPDRAEAVRLGLSGPQQGANAALATGAAAALLRSRFGRCLTARALRAGLGKARLSGRHEWRRLRGGRAVLLDVAHNPAAAAALARALRREIGARPLTLLFGVMADKDAAGMLKPLLGPASHAVFCRPRHRRARNPRTLPSLMPAGASRRGVTTRVVRDPSAAFDAAIDLTPPGGVILVTGSFYLLGDLAARTTRLPRLDPRLRRHTG